MPAAVEAVAHPARSRGFAWSTAVFSAALAVICAVTVFTGLARMRLFEHDIFFLLGNAYRVAQGQVPHRDFSSAWGPVMYLIDAAGLLLSRMHPDGIAYANAVFAALIGVWAFWIGQARLCGPAACWMGIYTALLIAAPFALGCDPFMFSYGMVYNRYGFALLGIILVECGAPPLGEDAGPVHLSKGAVSSGAALAVLGFLKVSYAMMAVPFLFFAYVWDSGRRKHFFTMCAACAVVSGVFLAYLRFDIPDLLQDLAMAASARSKSWKPAEILSLGFGQFAESLPLAFLGAAAWLAKASQFRPKLPVRELLLTVGTLAVGGVLLSTNHQHGMLPLNVFAAVVLANDVVRVPSARQFGARALAVMLLAVICVVPPALSHAVSLAAAARESRRPDDVVVRLASPRGASISFGPEAMSVTTERGGAAYVMALNDGLALLRRHSGAGTGS